jgi:hypothetical protein
VENSGKPKLTYPVLGLSSALLYVRKLFTKFQEASFAREEAIAALELSNTSGYTNNIFSAGIQYGLLEKIEDRYRVTSLGQALIKNGQDVTKLKEASLKPQLFTVIYKTLGPETIKDHEHRALMDLYGIAESQIGLVVKAYNDNINVLRPALKQGASTIVQDGNSLEIVFASGVKVSVPKALIYELVMRDMTLLK